MKNLIIQVWSDNEESLPDYAKISKFYMQKYARRIGATYCFIQNFKRKGHPAAYVKHAIFDSDFDEFDNVLIVDTDVYVGKHVNENIFDEVGGGADYSVYGLWFDYAKKGDFSMGRDIDCNLMPEGEDELEWVWQGGVIKLTREQRIILRKLIQEKTYNISELSSDEVFFPLAFRRSGLEHKHLDYKWNAWMMCSLEEMSKYTDQDEGRVKRFFDWYVNFRDDTVIFENGFWLFPNMQSANFIHLQKVWCDPNRINRLKTLNEIRWI